MIDESMMDDEELEKALERELELANEETRRLMTHWGSRNANPMIVVPVVVTAMLTSLRLNLDKDSYDEIARSILAAVEADMKQNEETDDGHRRGVH